jgi:16S rRNA (uracil1498-N3)-methyltransferase
MPAERFFIKNPSFSINECLTLEGDEFHHLSHVMRLRVGETAELINGMGSLAEVSVKSISKHSAELQITSVHKEEPPKYQLILAEALPRFTKLEYVIEKSVELGVTDLWLFPGKLSEKKDLSPTQMERIHHITLSAMKQCGRLFMPKIQILSSLLEWKKETIAACGFFGDTDPSALRFIEALQSLSPSSLLIVIGPEKGFHKDEVIYMEKTLGIKGVSLHKNILRTETAAIHALSLASSFV